MIFLWYIASTIFIPSRLGGEWANGDAVALRDILCAILLYSLHMGAQTGTESVDVNGAMLMPCADVCSGVSLWVCACVGEGEGGDGMSGR